MRLTPDIMLANKSVRFKTPWCSGGAEGFRMLATVSVRGLESRTEGELYPKAGRRAVASPPGKPEERSWPNKSALPQILRGMGHDWLAHQGKRHVKVPLYLAVAPTLAVNDTITVRDKPGRGVSV